MEFIDSLTWPKLEKSPSTQLVPQSLLQMFLCCLQVIHLSQLRSERTLFNEQHCFCPSVLSGCLLKAPKARGTCMDEY